MKRPSGKCTFILCFAAFAVVLMLIFIPTSKKTQCADIIEVVDSVKIYDSVRGLDYYIAHRGTMFSAFPHDSESMERYGFAYEYITYKLSIDGSFVEPVAQELCQQNDFYSFIVFSLIVKDDPDSNRIIRRFVDKQMKEDVRNSNYYDYLIYLYDIEE